MGIFISKFVWTILLENLSIANSLIILIGMVVYFFVKKTQLFLIVGFMLSCIGNIIMFLNFNYF